VVSAARSKGTYVAAHCGGSEAAALLANAGVRSIEHAYELNETAAKLLKEKQCYLVPTLGVTRSPGWFENSGFPPEVLQRLQSFEKVHMQSARIAHREGVQLLNGVDMPPGDSCEGVKRRCEGIILSGGGRAHAPSSNRGVYNSRRGAMWTGR